MTRYDIFVSYSRANNACVQPLVELLRSRGYRVFYDQQEIQVGDEWKQRINRDVVASRVLVLCWSREAAASEYVHYELFRAAGLKRPVLPWLMDSTHLPKLVEIEGIIHDDPAEVLARLKPRLGLQLRWRRLIQAALLLLALAAAFAGYRYEHRPWLLTGVVRSFANEAPLAGVSVEVTTAPGTHPYTGKTDQNGRYSIPIPLPRPDTVDVLFYKTGFVSDHETAVTTAQDYTMYLRPSP